jgi:hypothetical protein
MEINIVNKDSYICVTINGQASLDASGWEKIESARTDVLTTIKKTGIHKLLFDCRDVSGKISTIDRFLLAVFFVKENMKFIAAQKPFLKITFVVNQSMIDADKFGEKVAHNRGLHGLVTVNIQEALKWLDLDTPLKQEP